jgi:GT2 family glycosyltransferase
LYGAKVLRKDGSFRGKTIVHAKKASPVMKRSEEKVAVVDGMLLAMKREAFTKVSGFNEDFAIHYYDKDISMRSLSRGMTNYILNVPFEHAAATTRKGIREDDKVREEARMKFIGIWRDHLPVDTSIWQEKISGALSVLGIRKKRAST